MSEFTTSGQAKRWTFVSAEALRQRRQSVCERVKSPLSVDEETALVFYFAQQSNIACIKLGFNDVVAHTAATFIRRLFTIRSVAEIDLKIFMAACIFLACKVEESFVFANDLCDALMVDANIVLSMECQLLADLQFDLRVFSPSRALRGFASSVAWTRGSAEFDEIIAKSRQILATAVAQTDVEMLFPPAQVALTALVMAAKMSSTPKESIASIEKFLTSPEFTARAGTASRDGAVAVLRENIARIEQMLVDGSKPLPIETVREIDRRLKTVLMQRKKEAQQAPQPMQVTPASSTSPKSE